MLDRLGAQLHLLAVKVVVSLLPLLLLEQGFHLGLVRHQITQFFFFDCEEVLVGLHFQLWNNLPHNFTFRFGLIFKQGRQILLTFVLVFAEVQVV